MGAATSQTAYTASKGGVLAMTREIAIEFARRGIRANALCPGPVNTPLLQPLLADPARRARRMVHLPMGRLAETGRQSNGRVACKNYRIPRRSIWMARSIGPQHSR
jgi:NAD(P)-dependent dehydrogenase (short-subunit alcohol dehydrogenase family)